MATETERGKEAVRRCMNIVKTPVARSKFKEARKTLFKVIAIET